MNEADEERDRELQLEVGCWIAGTRLYLVHACRCCLVTERKQIERRELESTSPFIFLALFLFLLLALAFSKVPTQARARKQRHTLSLCVSSPLTHIHKHTQSVKAVSLISSQGGWRPPVRKTVRKRGQGEAEGERCIRQEERGEKLQRSCCHSICCSVTISHLFLCSVES